MGNINDYALPSMKRKLGVTGTENDPIYLEYLHEAVTQIGGGLTVSVTGISYTVSPAPTATSPIWDAIAWGAVCSYRANKLREFQEALGGAATLRDAVSTLSRDTTMREMRFMLAEDRKAYIRALARYRTDASSPAPEEMGLRESELKEQ
jgi:hypothetical protein